MIIFIIKILTTLLPEMTSGLCRKIFNFFKNSLKKERLLWISLVAALIIYTLLPLRTHIFNTRWSAFATAKQYLSIDQQMIDIVKKCGNGSNISRIVIGKEPLLQSALSIINDLDDSQDGQSLIIDKVYSCNKDRTRFRKDNDCVLGIDQLRIINPIYGQIIPIDDQTLESINSDILELGNHIYRFSEFKPIWIKLRNSDGEMSFEAKDLKKKAPLFYTLIRIMREDMKDVGASKVKNYFNDVVYVFVLSFWRNTHGLPESKCVDAIGSENILLEDLARSQKNKFN